MSRFTIHIEHYVPTFMLHFCTDQSLLLCGSSRPSISAAVSRYWLEITQITLRIVLEHLIFHKPQSLFPVDIDRKFVFGPPVGMFFDEINIVPLRAALGEEMMEMYRTAAKEIQLV